MEDGTTGLYVVKHDDTLEKIAARVNITPGLIKSLNRLSDRNLYPGQTLKIPAALQITPASGDAKPQVAEKSSAAKSPLKPSAAGGGKLEANAAAEELRKFLKIKSKFFTRCDGTVGGLLLVTPNSIMFDPDLMHPLIVEKGPAEYTVTAPLGALVSLAMYEDLPLNAVDDVTRKADEVLLLFLLMYRTVFDLQNILFPIFNILLVE